MNWYQNLYIGQSIAGTAKAKRIKRRIDKGKAVAGDYVICLAEHEEELLDIYPASVLEQPYYSEYPVYAVGLAAGRMEAMQLAGDILFEVYNNTGGFDVRTYFSE